MRLKCFWFLCLALLWLSAGGALYGQEIRGSIVGNVTDPSGAGVPAAQITIRNEGTGIETKVTTGAAGTYTVPDLLAGIYSVTAVKEGFKAFHATGIQLLSAQTTRQDVVLEVGAVQQTVEIVARVQLVQTDSPTIGGTLQVRELTDLPFITTTMDGLFNLVPGMSQGEKNGNANPAIGGAPFLGSSNFTLNGITTSNPGQGGGGNVTYIGSNEMIAQANLPSIGTMQEFKVDSSVVGADERSQTAVSVVTKQGTNKFHGTAYEYNENKATAANDFELNASGQTQNPFNRNQFGVNVGGPILRDKLFFFVNYDGIREIHPSPDAENFPSMAMRQGDFSAMCDQYNGSGVCTDSNPNSLQNVQLYNPLTGQPFAGNIIPPNMITSQAKIMDAFMPALTVPTSNPNSLGLPNDPASNWYGAIPLRFGTNNEQGRIDSQLGTKDSVVAFAQLSRGLPWFYGYQGPGNYGNWVNHGYNWLNFSLTETHTFGSGMVNEFRVGWVHAYRNKDGQNTGFHPWDIFPGMPPSASLSGGLPAVNQSGYRGLYDVGVATGRQDTVDWVDNFTMVHGRHTLKFGFEESGYKEFDQGGLSGQPPLGTINFSGQWTGGSGFPAVVGTSPGNAYADYLLGYADSSSYGVNTQPYLTSRQWDGYALDTWKVSSRLTVSAGVRYIYQKPWVFRDHNATFFDIANNKLVLQENLSTATAPPGADPRKFALYPFETTQSIGASLNYFNDDKNNWAPRVGFAFRPSSDNRTVIRGGYGVYYSFNADWVGWRGLQSMPPWGATNSFSSNLPGGPDLPAAGYQPDLTFANLFPSGQIGGISANPSLTVLDQRQLNPVSQQWNLTLERQVGENWSFRGTYLGNSTRHMVTDFNSGNNINAPVVQQPNVPGQAQQILQPWSSINYYTYSGIDNFNQMQLEIQRRFNHGLMFRTEYDWTRQLSNANPYGSPQDPHNLGANYGNDPLVYRHRFLTYYVYELPVGQGRKFLGNMNKFEDGVLGGWRLSGITTYHSGEPVTAFLSIPSGFTGWSATWPDCVPGQLYSRGSGHDIINGVPWFNPGAFAPPQPFAWGNAQPMQMFGAGFGDWDFSVMKQFKLPRSESNKLEFKVDFFNLPNHLNLGDPNNYIADVRDGGPASPKTGQIQSEGNGYAPRQIQIGLRLFF